jgi:hypothetical protein
MLQQVVYIITTDLSEVEKRVPEIWSIRANYLPTTLTKKDPSKTSGNVMNFVLYFSINSEYNLSNKCTMSEDKWKTNCSGSEHTECLRYQQ